MDLKTIYMDKDDYYMSNKLKVNENLINIPNSLVGDLPIALPFSISLMGVRLINRILYKEKYEELNVLIQNRIFLEYMPDDLLKNCLYILRKEKFKRFKLKINKLLKFNLFKIYD